MKKSQNVRIRPAFHNLFLSVLLSHRSDERLRLCDFEGCSDWLRQSLKWSGMFWTLKGAGDLLFLVCQLFVQRTVHHCTVDVQQVYICYISDWLVNGCWTIPHLSCNSFLHPRKDRFLQKQLYTVSEQSCITFPVVPPMCSKCDWTWRKIKWSWIRNILRRVAQA